MKINYMSYVTINKRVWFMRLLTVLDMNVKPCELACTFQHTHEESSLLKYCRVTNLLYLTSCKNQKIVLGLAMMHKGQQFLA